MNTFKPEAPDYIEQHKKRLSHMPWLYFRLKPRAQAWAKPWQDEIQARLQALETVSIGNNCFIAPDAHIFAEPGRDIVIGDNSYIASGCFLHGPIRLGKNVSINAGTMIDGGSRGVVIGDNCRIAAACKFYAFNHGLEATRTIGEQATSSVGIELMSDVWLGAGAGVVDGVVMAEGSVAGMNAQVCHSTEDYVVYGGNPAKAISRRT